MADKRKQNTGSPVKRKIASREAKRRRAAARARLISLLLVLLLCTGVMALVRLGSKSSAEIVIDAADYVCLNKTDDEPEQDESLTDDDTPAENEPAVPAVADENIASVARILPKLRDSYPIEMVIRSEYAIVYDVQSDEVLYAKNAEEKCYPASTTKILTSAVVLNNVEPEHVFTVGDELDFVNPGSSLAYLGKGNQLDTEMLIDGLMLPSGNDAAYTAAASVGRILMGNENASPKAAVQSFVDEMNRTAQAIGCRNTHFADPDGFHDDEHYTTVWDMLKITLYGERFDMLTAAAAKPQRYVTFLSGEEISWENSNKLIHEYSDCYYMYATGMKTGMTDESGYCVVATAERFGHEVICIVFGASASDIRWNDTIALLDAAFVQIRARDD